MVLTESLRLGGAAAMRAAAEAALRVPQPPAQLLARGLKYLALEAAALGPGGGGDAHGGNGAQAEAAKARIRAVFRRLLAMEDPRADAAGGWRRWREFEARHGTAASFEDVQRASRAAVLAVEAREVAFDTGGRRVADQ